MCPAASWLRVSRAAMSSGGALGWSCVISDRKDVIVDLGVEVRGHKPVPGQRVPVAAGTRRMGALRAEPG